MFIFILVSRIKLVDNYTEDTQFEKIGIPILLGLYTLFFVFTHFSMLKNSEAKKLNIAMLEKKIIIKLNEIEEGNNLLTFSLILGSITFIFLLLNGIIQIVESIPENKSLT